MEVGDTSDQIVDAVNTILIEDFELDQAQLHTEATLAEDLGLDSLDAVDLIALIERKTGFMLSDEEAQAMRTLGDVYNFINTRSARRESEDH